MLFSSELSKAAQDTVDICHNELVMSPNLLIMQILLQIGQGFRALARDGHIHHLEFFFTMWSLLLLIENWNKLDILHESVCFSLSWKKWQKTLFIFSNFISGGPLPPQFLRWNAALYHNRRLAHHSLGPLFVASFLGNITHYQEYMPHSRASPAHCQWLPQ